MTLGLYLLPSQTRPLKVRTENERGKLGMEETNETQP